MPLLKIDDAEFMVEKGTTVLQAALANGIEIPHYCYHPALEIVGSCRMCLVKVEGMPKLQVSCNTVVSDTPPERKIDGKYDMVVNTQDEIVQQERKNILEFLLLNHPLDCPVCDQAGECFLQDYAFRYGNAHSRFEEEKRVNPNELLGSQIVINHNRCILCSRCVRFTREISGTNELFVEERGYRSKIAALDDKPLDNQLAGNVADICPVGALLSTDYIHKNRIWNLQEQSSVCQDCSVGCNVDVFYQKDQIFRLTPRENHDVNGYFMCDIGRYGFHRFEEIERVTLPLVKSDGNFTESSWEEAIVKTAEELTNAGAKSAGVASPFHTNEANFILGRLMDGNIGTLPAVTDEEVIYPSGFRISADRSPNQRGMNDVCPSIVEDFASTIEGKDIRFIYILDDGIDRKLDDRWKELLEKVGFVVVQSYAMTDMAKYADIVLPGEAPFEREGTITNDAGRVQWLRPSITSKGEARPDWKIPMLIQSKCTGVEAMSDVSAVMNEMGKEFPIYAGITFFRLGDQGLPLNGKGEM
ncbi:MAG: molybdopterin-dependent oxidoreductase [Candidatus Neomarinimicrobiota bacterium]|nr:molybdopterin-dependent oxidoreductase [Candidatus Neomarinimicrobiota bacterium]